MTGSKSSFSDLLSDWERDGFFVIKELLSQDDLILLRAQLFAIRNTARVQTGVRRVVVGSSQSPIIEKISGLAFTEGKFRDVAMSDKIKRLLKLIYPQSDGHLFRDVVVVKPARSGCRLSAHQDSAYWPVKPTNLCSFWIALTDIKQENSPLVLIPGSHKRGVLPHSIWLFDRIKFPKTFLRVLMAVNARAGVGDNYQITGTGGVLSRVKLTLMGRLSRLSKLFFRLTDLAVSSEETSGAIQLHLTAGDAVVFHSCLVHGSTPNTSDVERIAAIFSYMPSESTIKGSLISDFPKL
jgi:ectoine hydroxylase-related dioxygenase (phytanoyl-CoA dioxygenase family)